jgi:uncharacterized Fe-S cluster-containing radical SAM superfamily enzyme
MEQEITETISTTNLMALHTIMVSMVTQNRITYDEAVEFLNTAGLSRVGVSDVWVDEKNNKYEFHRELIK